MKNELKPERLPSWKRIADDLAAGISAGRYAEGEALPTALILAAQYEVNRHTVRQAFQSLQSLGLVSIEQGRGTFVRGRHIPYPIGRSVSFRQNLRAAGLESEARLLSAETITDAPASATRALKLDVDAPVWRVKTLHIAGQTPISMATHHLDARRFPDLAVQLEKAGASITETFKLNGIPHYERLSTRLTARSAKSKEAKHLNLSKHDPVLCSHAIDGLTDGTVLQVLETVFAANRVEFVIDNKALRQ